MKMNLQKALSILLILVSLTITSAQTTTKPETFPAFWTSFKAAMARNDKEAIADVTKLPFLFDSKERDRAGFIQIFNQLFTRKIRQCIAKAKPSKEGEHYDVFCGELIFYFGKDTDGKYKFLEFGVND
jgi:hypothetical protein